MPKTGEVVAVCTSPAGNVPKYPQKKVEVGFYGFVGDHHAGPTRVSRRTKQEKPNERQVSLVAEEVLQSLNKELGISLAPGDLAENITTRGLGDLSDIPVGARVAIGNGIVLEVTEHNVPCKNLMVYHRHVVKKIMGRRGLLAVVVAGAGVAMQAGDIIKVLEKVYNKGQK